MRALTVDDELPMLMILTGAVEKSPDIQEVVSFSSCSKALEYVEKNMIQVAFLDISMRGMGGIALAEKILEYQPECKIIFCTGHEEYAVEAFQIHATGYLLKPITEEAVQKEISYIIKKKADKKLLTVKCFGRFEAFSKDGKPLDFKRTRSKELLAILTNANGSRVTAKQICAIMWEDDTDKKMGYFRQLLSDLRNALEKAGAEKILCMNGYSYYLDTTAMDCDYYEFMKNGAPKFYGEFMSQYSWAEESCGFLWYQDNENFTKP